ncbi:GNAT family N-acetyltransferase [Erythrobacter sp. THAF29]|uniref:GNAT family N-acetyltransferase n=1 Tax=Erythrobacter sp. THAF29 TaxID=2587851 RepID=UPI001267BDFE|nr:GNAT family N-acetyltransferase [Erythrobacter sp. THAF29]QFT76346.1 Acetyltransferase (GNAT) family protein [Erythrobacter sp. THAF29]
MAEAASDFRHETDRLILRDWREKDWAPFWEGTNTPAVMRWLGGVADEATRLSAQARLMHYRRDFGHTFWVIERKEDGAILGFCGLKRCTDENGPFGMMEAGWRLREDAWGKGYAKEAAIATLDVGFDHFGADEIIALTVEKNTGSWGLMRRLGMERRPDLDFPETMWSQDYGDVIVHSITRENWESRDG